MGRAKQAKWLFGQYRLVMLSIPRRKCKTESEPIQVRSHNYHLTTLGPQVITPR